MTLSEAAGRSLSVEVVPDREQVVLIPRGELDMLSVPLLAEQANELERSGFTRLMLDLDDLTFIDSTGIRFIVDRGRRDGVAYTIRLDGNTVVRRALDLAGVLPHLRRGEYTS